MNYDDFIKSKMPIARSSGFKVSEHEINPILKPHERDAVR
jgi:hypothetical protein